MSSVSNDLDPIEAAQDEIRRSKRAVASALDDLSQHHSWLEAYHRDERRRAQRLRRQETMQALERRRQRAAWIAQRFAKTSFGMMRTTSVVLARNGAAVLAGALSGARALALLLARETSAAVDGSWRTGRVLARKGYRGAAIGFASTVRSSDELGMAFRKRLSTDAALLYAAAATRAHPILQPALKQAWTGWIRARSRSKRLAYTLHRRASDTWSRPRSSATQVARDTVMATSQGCAKLAEKAVTLNALGRERVSIALGSASARVQDFTRSAFQAASNSWSQAALRSQTVLHTCGPQNRALVVRQCTALVCIEPRRDRLPVVRPG